MTDQPVTPDREALKAAIRAVSFKAHQPERVYVDDCIGEDGVDALADGLLPYLTDALDRAQQQGRDDAAATIEAKARNLEFLERQTAVRDTAFAIKSARVACKECADLARGADREAIRQRADDSQIRTPVGPLWPGMVHCFCGISVALQNAEGYWRTEGRTVRDETGLRCPHCHDLLVREPVAPNQEAADE